ncbi:MAG: hypothetical protein DWQ37_12850 [Planctomycetota bacterium]|nr:MAG: hypothetical protein DWQ37_12850 [Planctomycetota bacterium]
MRILLSVFAIALLGSTAPLLADEVDVDHGGLQVTLPEKPMQDTQELDGDGQGKPALQHRLIINKPNGSIIVWYQDAPNVKDPQPALKRARDSVVRLAGGEVSDEKPLDLQGHPGVYFVAEIPGKGEFRVAYYHSGSRFYQVMAVGTPEFTHSAVINKMFESVKFAEKAPKE